MCIFTIPSKQETESPSRKWVSARSRDFISPLVRPAEVREKRALPPPCRRSGEKGGGIPDFLGERSELRESQSFKILRLKTIFEMGSMHSAIPNFFLAMFVGLAYNEMHMENTSFFKRLTGKLNAEEPEYKIDLATAKVAPPNPDGKDEEPVGQLTVDIYHTPEEIFVESAIAGARPEDIDVNVSPDSLSIVGLRRRELQNGAQYLHQECYWGRFTRSIILPEEVDPQNANVNFKNGILCVRMPKTNRKKTRKLEVRMD
jgi:HSP20 family protein